VTHGETPKQPEKDAKGKWLGRRPKGQQDTHSFHAFLKNTPRAQLVAHLERHHKGLAKGAKQ
jgi:hypothetical protein